MASRFGHRENRNSLFSAYDAQTARTHSQSPSLHSNTNGYPSSSSFPAGSRVFDHQNRPNSNPTFSAYPSGGGPSGGGVLEESGMSLSGSGHAAGHFRVATPNRKGQYSDAVLNELESQNEEHLEGMSAKVRMLKEITIAIGDEIRDSTKLAETMNSTFENTRLRLKGTMNRMLRMAEKTGVGWKVWLLFFLGVVALFCYVRLF